MAVVGSQIGLGLGLGRKRGFPCVVPGEEETLGDTSCDTKEDSRCYKIGYFYRATKSSA